MARSVLAILLLVASAIAVSARPVPIATPVNSVQPAKVNTPEIRAAAHNAIALLNKESAATLKALGLVGPIKVGHTTKATAQVVAGMKYNLSVMVKGAGAHEVLVKVSVLSQPWMTPAWTLLSYSCK